MAAISYICLFAALALAVTCETCTHNGITYARGDRYTNNCNGCTCVGNNIGFCDRMGCPPKPCTVDGKQYGAWEKYMDSDGCTVCTCNDDGSSSCNDNSRC